MGDVKTEVSRFKLQDLQKCSFSGSTSVDIIDNQQLNSSDDGVYITRLENQNLSLWALYNCKRGYFSSHRLP